MDYLEFYNNVFNLSTGWTNWYWANETLNYLNKVKSEALKYKGMQPQGFYLDIKSVYKQIAEFEYCLGKQVPKTELLEERFTLAAYEYALNNKPIVLIDYHTRLSNEEARHFIAKFKHDVFQSLISFYVYNQKAYPFLYNELKDKFIKFLCFCKSLKTAFPGANYIRPEPFIMSVVKKAIKEKDTAFAMEILNTYECTPSSNKEVEELEKLKKKLLN